MKINKIDSGAKDVSVKAEVVEVEEPRTVRTRYGSKKVASALIEDESGRIKLSLWEDNIEKVKQGSKIKIENAFVTEWNDELQLNLSKQSTMEVE